MSNEIDSHSSYTPEDVARIRNNVLAGIANDAKNPINIAGIGKLLMGLDPKLAKQTTDLIKKGINDLPDMSPEQKREFQINILKNAFESLDPQKYAQQPQQHAR